MEEAVQWVEAGTVPWTQESNAGRIETMVGSSEVVLGHRSSRSFKVINVNTPEKRVTSANCYDKIIRTMYVPISNRFDARRATE